MIMRSNALPAPVLRAVATVESNRPPRPALGDGETAPRKGWRQTGLVLSLLASGCMALIAASADGATEQRLLNGGAIGTGFGVFGTALTGGCVPCGAMVGLMVGTGIGHLYDVREHNRRPAVAVWRLPG